MNKIEEITKRYIDFSSSDVKDPKDFPDWRQVMKDIEYLLTLSRQYAKGYQDGYESAVNYYSPEYYY